MGRTTKTVVTIHIVKINVIVMSGLRISKTVTEFVLMAAARASACVDVIRKTCVRE